MAAARDQFLQGMSHAASTVSVVTTDGPCGRAGLTVSAMCAVSADPPSLLVCLHHLSHASDVLRGNGVFCVNVLRDDQASISDVFAGRIEAPRGDRFACAAWTHRTTGAPALRDALVVFDCRVRHDFQWGSHIIFVAEILDIGLADPGPPLIYANRAYGTPVHLDAFARAGRPTRADALDVGCFVTLGPFFLPRLLGGFVREHPQVTVRLHEGAQGELLDGVASGRFDLALMYDVGDTGALTTELLAEIAPYVLLPAEHPLARASKVSLVDLAAEPMVLLDVAPSRKYCTALFRDAGLEPTVRFHSPSFEMVRGMVANGLGYALLVTKPANNMSYDGKALVTRALVEDVAPGRVVLARRSDVEPGHAATALIDHCRHFFTTGRVAA